MFCFICIFMSKFGEIYKVKKFGSKIQAGSFSMNSKFSASFL